MSTASFDASPSSFAIWCTLIFAISALTPTFAPQLLSLVLPKILHCLCPQSGYLRPADRHSQRPGETAPTQCLVDAGRVGTAVPTPPRPALLRVHLDAVRLPHEDRKSTRLNSSHVSISYAV